jgi:hypothetical protein
MITVRILLISTFIALISFTAFGRPIQIIDPKTLIAESKLVFVGKVQSVTNSGITTHLSYPTWERTSFPWLKVEVEVLVPIKGVHKGDIVQTMLLSIDTNNELPMYSPPEVLEPDNRDIFFVCLGPTPLTNTFAALTGPCDENLSVVPLLRSHETSNGSLRDEGKQLLINDKRFALIWKLVSPEGKILPEGVAKLRRTYAAEISKVPTNDLVYLEWEAYTNEHGWWTDVPKGFSPTNSNVQKKK